MKKKLFIISSALFIVAMALVAAISVSQHNSVIADVSFNNIYLYSGIVYFQVQVKPVKAVTDVMYTLELESKDGHTYYGSQSISWATSRTIVERNFFASPSDANISNMLNNYESVGEETLIENPTVTPGLIYPGTSRLYNTEIKLNDFSIANKYVQINIFPSQTYKR
jgi:hypothetical protein